MAISAIPEKTNRAGLAYWMQEVLEQCAKAEHDFSSDSVHDLRTSLRRCRSLADGIRVFDRDPAWKKMRRAAKELFNSLGELRDTHVMIEWVRKLSPDGDAAGANIQNFLTAREQESRQSAAVALQRFDRGQWKSWTGKLPARATRVPPGSAVAAHLALERWNNAHALHHRASRNRTNVAFHDLRIAIKRFRYTIENFLPALYRSWSSDLKEIQDVLGELHDLDVLWLTAMQIKAFPDAAARAEWRTRLLHERKRRLDLYRAKMTGKGSLWIVWRKSLPADFECRALGLDRMKIWASFLDSEISHTEHVAQLALQVYEGVSIAGILRSPRNDFYRWILKAAASMHEVGRGKTNSGYHKASARLIKKMDPPLGWTSGDMRLAALTVRYHRGALPTEAHKGFAALSDSKRRMVQFLGGILRLACACDWKHNRQIAGLRVESVNSVITVRAQGYVDSTPLAGHIAAARHLLELTCRRPVFVLPDQMPVKEKLAVHIPAA